MPSFAPNYTPRLKVGYHVAGLDHTIQLRGSRTTDLSTMSGYVADVHDFFDELSGFLADDFTFISAAVAEVDSDVFVPVGLPAAVTGQVALADFTPNQKIIGTTFSGTGNPGRARVTAYGLQWLLDQTGGEGRDFVVFSSEEGDIASAIAVLAVRAYTNGNTLANWHPRATIKPNDHLVKLVRRGLIT